MRWYHYVALFFSGAFLANFVPHFVNGISGNPFPTPFSNPPGQGLSSSVINVIWALGNLLIGYLLLRTGKLNSKKVLGLIIFFLGIASMSILIADAFTKKAAIETYTLNK